MSDTLFPFTRRGFMLSAAGGMSAVGAQQAAAGRQAGDMPWNTAAVVKKVYLSGKPGWPRPDMNLDQEIKEVETNLAQLERRYPGRIRFVGGEVLHEPAQVAAWSHSLNDVDAILAFSMTAGIAHTLQQLLTTDKPTLLFARPYSGHDWSVGSALAQVGKKVDVIASSDYAELDPYVDAFETIHHLRHSKILVITPGAWQPKAKTGNPADYEKQFGTAFAYPTYADLKGSYEAADQNEAGRLADDFIKRAIRVVEPSRGDIVDSMRLRLGMLDLMRREKANAIAIDCIGGFGRGELPAYPCVGFSMMNDEGQYGLCEADVEAGMTMLLVKSFSGKPGFISDPAFDTSRNEVVHAHCVCATKMAGLGEPGSPYIVRTHLEDHKGVSMQVLLHRKGPVTVARFMAPTRFVVSTAEATGNVDDERGCRTKMCTRVTDARKFLRNYGMVNTTGISPSITSATHGTPMLHRVVFYGDHVEMIERLGRLTGFQVIRET